jgi:hypothetical protein
MHCRIADAGVLRTQHYSTRDAPLRAAGQSGHHQPLWYIRTSLGSSPYRLTLFFFGRPATLTPARLLNAVWDANPALICHRCLANISGA